MTDFEDSAVIDWEEAMQQCGDDEEFLRELLGDLREETDSQVATMDEILKSPTDNPYLGIARAAHVIKGAASNLMCEQLRTTAMALETTAQVEESNKKDEKDKDKKGYEHKKDNKVEICEIVKKKFADLKVAVKNYHEYLEEVDV